MKKHNTKQFAMKFCTDFTAIISCYTQISLTTIYKLFLALSSVIHIIGMRCWLVRGMILGDSEAFHHVSSVVVNS